MRTLIICAAGALALAACQRPATEETAEVPVATDAVVDATPTDATGDAATPAPPSSSVSRSTSRSSPAKAPVDAPTDSMGTPPADEATTTGPSPAVRDAAKEKAEETNLHPRPH